jgi:hypothetical protein
MVKEGYFISHTEGLVIAYLEWVNTNDDGEGYLIKKILLDEEGWFTIQYNKKKTIRVDSNGLMTNPKHIIPAIFDPNKDSWSWR